jgi:hypothetical protein
MATLTAVVEKELKKELDEAINWFNGKKSFFDTKRDSIRSVLLEVGVIPYIKKYRAAKKKN